MTRMMMGQIKWVTCRIAQCSPSRRLRHREDPNSLMSRIQNILILRGPPGVQQIRHGPIGVGQIHRDRHGVAPEVDTPVAL